MRDFQLLAHFVHGKVLELEHGVVLPFKPLSAREREVLSWAATGLTNDQIAYKLSISERVVRAYFESARHKLNCLNRSHVLARAVSMRIVGPASSSW
jgi:DNA-binding CsgD family transcriptional regulator